jgi:hypothetical protein
VSGELRDADPVGTSGADEGLNPWTPESYSKKRAD